MCNTDNVKYIELQKTNICNYIYIYKNVVCTSYICMTHR